MVGLSNLCAVVSRAQARLELAEQVRAPGGCSVFVRYTVMVHRMELFPWNFRINDRRNPAWVTQERGLGQEFLLAGAHGQGPGG